jgi:hypothetical protein
MQKRKTQTSGNKAVQKVSGSATLGKRKNAIKATVNDEEAARILNMQVTGGYRSQAEYLREAGLAGTPLMLRTVLERLGREYMAVSMLLEYRNSHQDLSTIIEDVVIQLETELEQVAAQLSWRRP